MAGLALPDAEVPERQAPDVVAIVASAVAACRAAAEPPDGRRVDRREAAVIPKAVERWARRVLAPVEPVPDGAESAAPVWWKLVARRDRARQHATEAEEAWVEETVEQVEETEPAMAKQPAGPTVAGARDGRVSLMPDETVRQADAVVLAVEVAADRRACRWAMPLQSSAALAARAGLEWRCCG
jgi:hypothetical protein